MSQIKSVVKVDVVRRVTLDNYGRTLDLSRDVAGQVQVTIVEDDPQRAERASLRRWLDEQGEGSTLDGLRAELDKRDAEAIVKWGEDQGKPRKHSVDFYVDAEQLPVLQSVLSGDGMSYETREILDKARVL